MNPSDARLSFLRWASCIAALIVLIALLPPSTQSHLAYSRYDIENGQLWRIITAHFVHQNPRHLMTNLFAWTLVTAWGCVFVRYILPWFYITLACSLAVSLGLYYFQPLIPIYVGFSGVIYGCLIAELTVSIRSRQFIATIGILFVVIKLSVDVFFGSIDFFSPFSPNHIPAVRAHIYGSIAGLVVGIATDFLHRGHQNTRKYGLLPTHSWFRS